MKYFFMIIFLSLFFTCMANEYSFIQPISIEEKPPKKQQEKPKVIVESKCKVTTTIVLLANEKTNSAIVIKTTKGESVINHPNYFVSVCTKDTLPTVPKPISQEEIDFLFADVVSVSYKKPILFVLYFDKKKLTSESKKKIDSLLREISDRRDSYIKITGYTDTKESSLFNKKLAKQRADSIAQIIKNSHAEHQGISIESYGEENLAIYTEDEVLEPLNRRVEILIQ